MKTKLFWTYRKKIKYKKFLLRFIISNYFRFRNQSWCDNNFMQTFIIRNYVVGHDKRRNASHEERSRMKNSSSRSSEVADANWLSWMILVDLSEARVISIPELASPVLLFPYLCPSSSRLFVLRDGKKRRILSFSRESLVIIKARATKCLEIIKKNLAWSYMHFFSMLHIIVTVTFLYACIYIRIYRHR